MRHIRFHSVESGESPPFFRSKEDRRVVSTERIDGWPAILTISRADLREKVTVINLEKVGFECVDYIIHEMPLNVVRGNETSSNLFQRRGQPIGINQRNNRPNFVIREARGKSGAVGKDVSWESNSMGSGKSDGETIRGDGKGINVSRKSKPGVGHKFAILLPLWNRVTNEQFRRVRFLPSANPSLSSYTRERAATEGDKERKYEANIHRRAFISLY